MKEWINPFDQGCRWLLIIIRMLPTEEMSSLIELFSAPQPKKDSSICSCLQS